MTNFRIDSSASLGMARGNLELDSSAALPSTGSGQAGQVRSE